MPRISRLSIAKKDIFALFDKASQKVYSHPELGRILDQHRGFWRLAGSTTVNPFIGFLFKQGKLKEHRFVAEAYGKESVRYSWGDASVYELAQSLRPRSYLTHATAVALHGLNDLVPRTIFINAEQSPKYSNPGSLTQKGIDHAFSRKQRQSNMIYKYADWSITVVNGKHTGGLGVEQLAGPSGENLRSTDIERTLIDIVVRPDYAGGIFQVLDAYRSAMGRLSTNRLVATLKKLDYVYPYHQAIGFLMQTAGYERKRYEMLRQLGLNYDFYLAHAMQRPEFSTEWRIYYPRGASFEATSTT